MDESVCDDNMENQVITFEDCLLELLDPSTTPEKALQFLSSPCLSSATYKTNDVKPVVIFLAYLRFIITRRPLDIFTYLDNIWEDILKKTLEYSRNFSQCSLDFTQCTLNTALSGFEDGSDNIFDHDIYNRIVPKVHPSVTTWLKTALEITIMCPNPYIRLELFRLNRLFGSHHRMRDRDAMCLTFFDTICKIKPHNLYPSGNADHVLFTAIDLDHAITEHKDQLKQIISDDLNQQLNKENEVINESDETTFISHCIQMIGVFAVIAESHPDDKIKFTELSHCCLAFKNSLTRIVSCDQLYRSPLFIQFRHVFTSRPPYRQYIIDTVRDLTMAIINYKPGNEKEMLMNLRDTIVQEQDLFDKTYKLPNLLLSRQVEGPRLVHQYSLLLKGLSKKKFDGSDHWYHIEHRFHFFNEESSNISNNGQTEEERHSDDSFSNDSEYELLSSVDRYFGLLNDISAHNDESSDSSEYSEEAEHAGENNGAWW